MMKALMPQQTKGGWRRRRPINWPPTVGAHYSGIDQACCKRELPLAMIETVGNGTLQGLSYLSGAKPVEAAVFVSISTCLQR